MRVLIRGVCIATLLLSVLLVVIIGTTYRDTNRFAYLFTKPDGSKCATPCLFGADPATMTFGQIEGILSASPILKRSEQDTRRAPRWASSTEAVLLTSNRISEESYTVSFYTDDAPTLGELLLLLGAPEQVAIIRTMTGSTNPQIVCGSLNFLMQGRIFDFYTDDDKDCLKHPL
jgi:hypothetical protein